MCNIQTEGFLTLCFDEFIHFLIEHIRRMSLELNSLAIDVQCWIKRGPLPLHTHPVIKTGAGRIVIPHMPFSDIRGRVTCFLEFLGKCLQRMAVFAAVDVIENSMIVRVASRQQTGPHGRTERRRTEGIPEPGPFARDPINVWRPHKRMSHAPQFVPAKIIYQHHNDIRLRGSGFHRLHCTRLPG